ncbi:putative disease resistance protein RGA3 [Cocos nucifera]|nr:putative disease resistance protein RGA3 [Cocos nucifera]
MPRRLGQLSNLQTLLKFIVAQEDGRTITELQNLNFIRNRLEIKNLHHVKNQNEAMQANLGAKMRLNHLKLEWNVDMDEAREPSSTESAGDVLEKLQPHGRNLRELDIRGCMGIRLPDWMASAELVLSSFPNLVKLTLWGLKRCEHLPPIGQLPLLKHLIVRDMHAVKAIGEEFYGDGGQSAFPSLEEFYLNGMPCLEEWHIEPTAVGRKIASFPRLNKLWITLCPKLTVQPCLPCSVEELTIEKSNEMLLSAGSLVGLCQPKRLEIWSCGVSSSSSSGWWDGLQYLTTLEMLKISECHELTCLPQGIMDLPSLHTLCLWGTSNLRSLDGGGRKQQQPTPFFTALQQLSIRECSNLAMMPDSLRHLTALQQLEIMGCPQLARRCKREIGEDWHKIAHIPRIKIWPEEDDGSTVTLIT